MDFSSMLNPQEQPAPQMQAPQAIPPQMAAPQPAMQDPASKRAQWSQLLEDPNMKSALFRMGLQMMQGQRQGESTGGAIGRNVIGAMDYYGAKNELDRKRGLEAQKVALDTRNVESQIGSRDATTAATNEELTQSKSKFAEYEGEKANRAAKARLEIDNLERAGKTHDAQLRKTQLELDESQRYADFVLANPKLAGDANMAKLRKPLLENAQTVAQTNQSNASAGNASATAANTRQKTQQEQSVFNAMPTWIQAMDADKEAQAYAMANKGIKTQPQIEEGIRNRLHHGFIESKTGTSADNSGYTAMAQSIVDQYKTADKKMFPTIEDYINMNFNVALGKSSGQVLGEVKRLQGTQADKPATPSLNFVRDKSGKLVPAK